MKKTSGEPVELGKGKELSIADELIDDTDVHEAQPDLIIGGLCVVTTEELDFWSKLDSEARGSLEQSEVINGMTSDRVEVRYSDPPPPIEYRSRGNRGISAN